MTDFEVIFCQNLELVPQFDAIFVHYEMPCGLDDKTVEIFGSFQEQVSGDLPSHRAPMGLGWKFCFQKPFCWEAGMGILPLCKILTLHSRFCLGFVHMWF